MKKPAPKYLWLLGGIFALAIAGYFSAPFLGDKLYLNGMEAKRDWRLKSAIQYFTWSERLSIDKTNSKFQKALTYQLHGNFLTSKVEFEALLAESIISDELKAQALNSNGVNLFNQNQSDKALLNHQESLKIARLINDKKLEAQALVDLSRVLYHTKGKFDEAKAHLERALEIGREIDDDLIIADALRNIGVVLWWGKGELDRPLNDFYEPAIALYRKNGDRRSEAMMLSNISHIYAFKGDHFQHMKLQNESLTIREEIEDQAGLSESYNALGQMYFNTRNFRKSREYLLKSYELSKKIGFRQNQNEAETYLAGVHQLLGEYDEAISIFTNLYEREKNNPGLAKVRLGAIANGHYLKGDYKKALVLFEEILEIEKKNGLKDIRSLMAVYTYLANTYMELDEFEKAGEMLKKAEEFYSKHSAGRIQGNFSYHLSQALFRYKKEKYSESLNFLEEAADEELNMFASSGSNIVTYPPPRDYDRLFSLLLEKLNKDENMLAEELAFRFLEQRRYRSFRNFIVQSSSKNIASTLASEKEEKALADIERINKQLKKNPDAELKKRLRYAYSNYENTVVKEQFTVEIQRAIKTVKPADLKTTQEHLDEKTALVEYILAGEKVFALVITKNKVRSFLLPVTTSNLRNKTHILQSTIFSNGINNETSDWQLIAKNLRESLIKPIENSGILEDKDRLAIIPFSFLHDLPFAALLKNENGRNRFLIEDYVLFFPPSATFLTVNKNSTQIDKLISFGRNSSDKSDLSPLKFAVEESKSVAEIFLGEAKVENDANETEFKNLARKATHLHFSTHAVAEPEMPLFSRLILKSTEEDDGNLTVREIFELGIDADLVTIAACEGARSFSADSEGLIEVDRIGLTEAFLHGGSKSVLASLSPASDKATTDLMRTFYRNLLKQDKANSLARAQRAMLHSQINKKFSHPRYWANFVLIGTDR